MTNCIYCTEPINVLDPQHKGYSIPVHRNCVSYIIVKYNKGMIKQLPEWMNTHKK